MFIAKKIIGSLLQPLPLSVIIALLGLYLLWFSQRQRLGKIFIGLALIIAIGFSTPFAGNGLIRSLEQQYPAIIDTSKYRSVAYIVVLGGGHKVDSSTPLSSHLNSSALKRLIEGLRLQGQLENAQLIVSGGAVFSGHREADTMMNVINSLNYTDKRIIIENQSRDTASQASAISGLVGVQPFLLVTSASHMPRSMSLMRQQGLKPIAAPTDFHVQEAEWDNPGSFFPDSRHLKNSERAIHEYLGQWWVWCSVSY